MIIFPDFEINYHIYRSATLLIYPILRPDTILELSPCSRPKNECTPWKGRSRRQRKTYRDRICRNYISNPSMWRWIYCSIDRIRFDGWFRNYVGNPTVPHYDIVAALRLCSRRWIFWFLIFLLFDDVYIQRQPCIKIDRQSNYSSTNESNHLSYVSMFSI